VRSGLNVKLRQRGRVVTRHYDAYMAATGLKTTQYSRLSPVVQLGPIRSSDLARRMGIDASMLTRNLQPLVAQCWLQQRQGHTMRAPG
jgi:DNA-binding MarR family transcriptional regulator